MVLTPMEIHDKTFEKKFKGYDEEEVDSYLDQIVNDYGDVLDENSDLKNEIDSLKKENKNLKEKVAKYDEIKESLNQSLISAQQHADNLQKQANEDAEAIKTQAQKEADKILEEAKSTASQYNTNLKQEYGTLSSDYDLLKNQVASFRQEIQQKLKEELDGLDDDAWQYFIDKYYGRSRLYPADGSQPVSADDNDDDIVELDDDEIAAEEAAAEEEEEELKDKIDKPTSNEVKSDTGSTDSDGPKILIGDSSNKVSTGVKRDSKESKLHSSDNDGPTIIFPDDNNDDD